MHRTAAVLALLAGSLAAASPIALPLDAFGQSPAQADGIQNQTITIEYQNQRFDLVPVRSATNAATGARIMSGGLSGEPGRFVLAEVDGNIAGAVWTDDSVLEFRPAGNNGEVRIIDIDAQDLPACATVGQAQPFEEFAAIPTTGAGLRGAPEEITRIFVGITRTGELQMGGPSAAIAVAAAAVESANTAYGNSLMTVGDNGAVQCRLELVGTFTVDPGTGLGAGGLLSALRSTTDGVMDELHVLRDASGADMVALLSESGIGACGVAYLAPDDQSRMFSVTAQSCAIGNLTFAHELGHNQGASHDAANAGNGYEPYGFGWRWNTSSGALRRSVMAYSPGSRRPHFSNPGVSESGGATGNAQQADNARLIGETFPTVASHRTGNGSGVGDCDANGTPDLLEILGDSTLDSDDSGTLDSCDLDNGLLEDCNNDGLADIGQVAARVELNPDPIFLLGFPPHETAVTEARQASTDVSITLSADADLSGLNEYLDVDINGIDFGRFWETDGADCDPAVTTTTIVLTAAEWNALGDTVTITADRSANVGAGCSGDTVNVTIEYAGLNLELDANANGVIDSCEPGCGIADIAEPFGTLDLGDISAFIGAFTAQSAPADLTGDGVYDLADIGAFVASFNAGCP